MLLVQLNRQDEAKPLFREALQFDPSLAAARYQLDTLLEKRGKTAQRSSN